MDGWIRIGTDIDTKTFDNQIEQCERELQDLQTQIENPDEIQIDTSEFDNKIATATEQLERMKVLAASGDVIAISGLERAEIELKKLNDEKAQFVDEKKTNFIDKANVQAEKLRNKIIDLTAKKNSFMLDNSSSFLSDISSGTADIINKVGKWGLAVFGVRTAYRAISSAMSVISQYNEQIGADIEYIKYAIAMTLQPVIETIINLVYKALSLLALLIKNLTGIDIFKDSGVDKFQAGMKNGAASSKKIKDNLNTAKFDEITKLGNTTEQSGGAGGGAGGISPSLDLSEANQEVETFYETTKQTWEQIGEDFSDMLADPSLFTKAFGNWDIFMYGIAQMAQGAYDIADGLFQGIGGIVQIVTGIFTGDMELIMKGFENLGEGLWKIIKGLVEFVIGVFEMIIGAFVALCREIADFFAWLIKTVWDAIVNFFKWIGDKLVNAGKWVYDNFIKPVGDFFADLWNKIVETFQNIGTWFGDRFAEARENVKNAFWSIVDFVRGIWDNITDIFSSIGSHIGEVLGDGFKGAINGAMSIVERLLNVPIRAINRLLDVINAIPGVSIGYLNPVNLPRLASGGIVNMPGRGVPLGSAIVGEAGQEGVIPLTNSSAMEELGEKIGKYVHVTVNSTLKLNNRILAQEVSKVNDQNDFIRNR